MQKLKNLSFFLVAFLFLFPFAVKAASVNELLRQPGAPIAGNPRGSVTVVEFFDYQCSHCVSMAPVMNNLISSNSNVRVVFKELPIRGPISEYASRAALAANKQGKYYPFSHALLNYSGLLTQEAILRIAQQTGLNMNKLKTDMNSSSVRDQIRSNYRLAQSLDVSGTPAFFIAPTDAQDMSQVKFVLGEMSLSSLQSAVASARR